MTDSGNQYEVKKDQREVFIGRHPDCQIKIDDKRISGYHMRIYRDEEFRYYVESRSGNGSYVDEHLMKKGETRILQHGDSISLCAPLSGINGTKPPAAYYFRLAGHESDPARGPAAAAENISVDATMHGDSPKPAAPNANMRAGTDSHYVTEDWVKQHWDTRTRLGSGNFSEVKLGVEVRSGEKRAVKIIDKKKFLAFQNKRQSQLSLKDEAEVLMDVHHIGIVKYYDWFETDNNLYLVMELLDTGGDLLQNILENNCFTEAQACRLFRQLCEAVAYLHAKGIVHRDLKPENILLTSKNREEMLPKIADFGLARKDTYRSRDCRTFCGTPHYFAPEVINTFRDMDSGHAGYGQQVDMWSLGVILYILLSGIPPFEEEDLYAQITEGKYEFDVREWTTVSEEAKELVRGLMKVNPKDRLDIKQTLEHKWFLLLRPASPRRRPNLPPATSLPPPGPLQQGRQPISIEEVPEAKRRRTSCTSEGKAEAATPQTPPCASGVGEAHGRLGA